MADTHAGHCPCFEDGAGQALPPTSELGVIMPCVMYVDHGDGILQFQEARAVKQPLQHVLCFQSTLSSKVRVHTQTRVWLCTCILSFWLCTCILSSVCAHADPRLAVRI